MGGRKIICNCVYYCGSLAANYEGISFILHIVDSCDSCFSETEDDIDPETGNYLISRHPHKINAQVVF